MILQSSLDPTTNAGTVNILYMLECITRTPKLKFFNHTLAEYEVLSMTETLNIFQNINTAPALNVTVIIKP